MSNPSFQNLVHLLWGHLDQKRVPHYDTSSNIRISALLAPCALSLVVLNEMTSWRPLGKRQHVPAPQSTRGFQLGTHSMRRLMATAPLKHPVLACMLITKGFQLCWVFSIIFRGTSRYIPQCFLLLPGHIETSSLPMHLVHYRVLLFLFPCPNTSWVDQLRPLLAQSTSQSRLREWIQHCHLPLRHRPHIVGCNHNRVCHLLSVLVTSKCLGWPDMVRNPNGACMT